MRHTIPVLAGLLCVSMAANCEAQEEGPWVGVYENADTVVSILRSGNELTGTITSGGRSFPLTAEVASGTLRGRFTSEEGSFEFSATRDGDRLVLLTGGKTRQLTRRDKKTRGKTNPLGRAPRAGAVDLSHLGVGQKYHYHLNLGGNEMDMVYEIMELTDSEVRYTQTTFMGGKAVGTGTKQAWAIPSPVGELEVAPNAETPPEETVTVAGKEWSCWVVDSAGIKTWVPRKGGLPTFPMFVKQMKGETVTIELVKIEEPRKAGEAKDAAARGIDVSHVKRGQKYTYAMQNNMQMVYEVTQITQTQIKYTTVVFMNGKPLADPTPQTMTLKFQGVRNANAPKAPEPTGEETVTVSGVAFPCRIYESTHGQSTSRSWTTLKFPCMVKAESNGKVSMELTKIE